MNRSLFLAFALCLALLAPAVAQDAAQPEATPAAVAAAAVGDAADDSQGVVIDGLATFREQAASVRLYSGLSGMLAPQPASATEDGQVNASAAGTASVVVDAPIPIGNGKVPARMWAEFSAEASPGSTQPVSPEDPTTFSSAGASFALYVPFGITPDKSIVLSAVAEYGWKVAFNKDGVEPPLRMPRSMGIGLMLQHRKSGSYVRAIWGRDQEAGPFRHGQGIATWDVAVPATDGVVHITGRAVLNVGNAPDPATSAPDAQARTQDLAPQRDLWRVRGMVRLDKLVSKLFKKSSP